VTEPAIDLLRHLAGRVPDDAMSGFRGYLGAGETTMMGDSLVGHLGQHQVPLTDFERALLAAVADADPGEIDEIPRVAEISRDYSFDGGAGAPDATETDARLITWLSHLPAARRLFRAWRRPLHAAAAGQATWLYLLELAPDGEIAAVQSQVPIGDATHGVIEVYQMGERLPQYHVEALRAARAVWSRDA
jgi:hypothetical protein